jgi:predicted DNA-binding transcriptional regulator AlpA
MHPRIRDPHRASPRESAPGGGFVDPDPKLRPEEAAQVTRLAVQTLARLRCEGRGPRFIRVGSRIVYRLSDIEAWLASRTAASTSDADRFRRGPA